MTTTSSAGMFRTNGFMNLSGQTWRVGVRRVRSEPSLTRLPPDKGIAAVATFQSVSQSGSPGVAQRERRLLRGVAERTTQLNSDTSAWQARAEGTKSSLTSGRRCSVAAGDDMGASYARNVRRQDFQEGIGSITESIADIRSSLEQFGGSASSQNAGAAQEEQEDKDLREDRLTLYRFVRKIEPRLPPLSLEPLFPDVDITEKKHNEIIQRNCDSETLRRYSPELRHALNAQLKELRMQRQNCVRDRRDKDRELQLERLLAKMSQYEERVSQVRVQRELHDAKKNKVRQAQSDDRLEQQRRSLTTLAMVSFLQRCREVARRYAKLRQEYADALTAVNRCYKLAPFGGDRMAFATCDNVLGNKFIEVARSKFCKRSSLPNPSQSHDSSSKSSDIWVQMPSEATMIKIINVSQLMHNRLMGRIYLGRKRKHAKQVVAALQLWRRGFTPLVLMRRFVGNARRIQAFWRVARLRLAKLHAQVAAEWVRLERPLVQADIAAGRIKPGARRATKQFNEGRRRTTKKSVTITDNASELLPDMDRKSTRKSSVTMGIVRVFELQELLAHGCTVDRHRDDTIRKELRERRARILPRLDLWRGDMRNYADEVQAWRQWRRSKESRRDAEEQRPPVSVPSMPPCPSYIPTSDEILEMVKLARAPKTGNPHVQQPVQHQSDERQDLDEQLFSPPADDRTSEQLCAEVQQLMHPPACTPWVA